MKEILPRIITDLVWVSAAHITHALRNDPTVNGTGRVISPTTKHIIFLFFFLIAKTEAGSLLQYEIQSLLSINPRNIHG
jgi:hypothetical protein